jgi:hypothetical protein
MNKSQWGGGGGVFVRYSIRITQVSGGSDKDTFI